MKDLSPLLSGAVASGAAPFVVVLAASAEQDLAAGAAGDAAPGRPAALDTVFRVYSLTKAVGALAAMIVVERGLLTLDMPVVEILPAFGELQVLEGFDGDRPILRPQRTVCTIRHLATHTSGLAYEHWNGLVKRWMDLTGHPSIFTGRRDALAYPLVADPGTSWHYGPGLDWLGQAVEAVDGRRIDAFCRQEIFDRLAMDDTVFELDPSLAARCAATFVRSGDGFRQVGGLPVDPPEFFGMGHALWSTAPDYMRFLRMLLGGGELDGVRIVSPETVATLLANHVGSLPASRLISVAPKVSADFDPFPGLALSHSLAFARLEEDVPGRRAAGSQYWGGALNSHCWLDPSSGFAGLYLTQLAPFADPRLMVDLEAFERHLYAHL